MRAHLGRQAGAVFLAVAILVIGGDLAWGQVSGRSGSSPIGSAIGEGAAAPRFAPLPTSPEAGSVDRALRQPVTPPTHSYQHEYPPRAYPPLNPPAYPKGALPGEWRD